MPSFSRLLLGCIAIVLFMGGSWHASAQITEARTKEIEAAFLLQFCRYVKWPDSSFSTGDAPLVIGILGRDPFGSVLDKSARLLRVNNRPVEIRRHLSLSSIRDSHILFVATDYTARMEDISRAIANVPVLTVSESEGFLQYGSINFVMIDKKVRFDISRQNAEKSGLKISAKLLTVAHKVI